MTSEQIRQWFTPERLEKLDFQKIEDLAGIHRGTIQFRLFDPFPNGLFKDESDSLTPLLKMIENGFNDCNKSTL